MCARFSPRCHSAVSERIKHSMLLFTFCSDDYKSKQKIRRKETMDTRYWGPSGWKLLHLIATKEKNEKMTEFIQTLPYVLPCKFCRASLSKYYRELPFNSQTRLDYWMYQIHNKVNNKLRKQGQGVLPNPPFSKVKKLYEDELINGCTRTEFPGWEFLFSVAKCHPLSREKSTPLPNAPPLETLKTNLQKNEWNVLEPEKRYVYWVRFWKVLPYVFPFEEWKKSWLQHGLEAVPTSKEMVTALWKVRCAFENDLELLNKTTYSNLCRDLSLHKSGCSKKVRAKTCRRGRTTTRKRHL